MLKMLIADDEPVIIRGLQMLIDWAQLGIEICATCENGADALREIFAQSPDLALLDISMPGKTGIEILKALHTAQSRTKVIFISGFQDFSYAHDALSYGAVDYLLKPVKKDDLLRAVEKCLPVQPDHSAPAPASDTGSYSDAFSRVAEMEPASYILTAVQPLGLTARNAMERQLIEFSIFGQLDTLCRQTGQGHQQPGEQLRRPGPVHRNLPAGQRPGHPQTARRGRKAPVPRQGPLQQPLRAGEHRAHLAPGHGQGQQKPQGAAAGPAVDDGGLFVIQGPQPPDRGLHIVGGVRRAGKLSRLGQTDQLPVQQAFGRRRRHRPPQRGRKQAHIHHTSSIRAARGTVSRRPWPARSATAMVMPSPPRFLSRAR